MNKQDLFNFLIQDYGINLLDSDMDLIIDICSKITEKENEQYKRTVKLKKGQFVVMHTCAEASSYNGKIWKTSSDSYSISGREVVFLEGFSGSFSTDYLAVVDFLNINKMHELTQNTGCFFWVKDKGNEDEGCCFSWQKGWFTKSSIGDYINLDNGYHYDSEDQWKFNESQIIGWLPLPWPDNITTN